MGLYRLYYNYKVKKINRELKKISRELPKVVDQCRNGLEVTIDDHSAGSSRDVKDAAGSRATQRHGRK